MPKLKQLTLQGFKSFADSESFIFPTGVTAVVGPNGSGKSNVADAIRWVLGEQRLTAIRGRTGEDMIFAGSHRRARSGMARAAITFDNSDGWLAVDFAEVTVERRTYRDGTSDYILNGNKVRLMDLRDLLDRAGLGRDAYLIVGQGLVDQVLSLRPQERLALFEQAAGITPYRARREDAVDRLEQTRLNLQRVHDIVGEIEPSLRRLQRQATKAQEHGRLRQELSETLRVWYGYRWGKALGDLEQARQRLAYQEDRALALLEQTGELEARVSQHREQITHYRDRLADLHRVSSAQHREAGERQQALAVARERQRQFRERIEESESNLVPLRASLEAEEDDLAKLEAAVATSEHQLQVAQEDLAEVVRKHRAVVDQRNALLRRQTEVRSRGLQLRHRLADRQSRLEQTQAHATELGEQIRRLETAVHEGREQRQCRQRDVEMMRDRLEEAESTLQQMQETETGLTQQLDGARADQEAARRAVSRCQADAERLTARLEALDRLHAEGAGMYAGVRAVLQAVERDELRGLPGPIATLVRVPSELERAMEAALGSQLQNVVAESWDAAQEAISWLKRSRAGRATFLPLDTLRPPTLLELPVLDGVIGVASELVICEPRFRPAVLLLLGRTAVVRSLDSARQLHHELKGGFRIVTLEGEIVRSGGSVTGGENRQAQGPALLARERERRELREEIAALRGEIEARSAAVVTTEQRVEALMARLAEVVAGRERAATTVRERDQALGRAVQELERVIGESRWQSARLSEAEEERQRAVALIAQLTSEVEAVESELSVTEASLADLETAMADLAEDELAQVVAERRTATAVLEQRRESRSVLLESRQREIARLQGQISAQEQRIAVHRDDLVSVETGMEALVEAYQRAQAEAGAVAAEIPPIEAQLAEMEVVLEGAERAEQASRRTQRDAEQRLAQVEIDVGRREDQLQSLRREIEETLEIVISNLPDTISTQRPLPLDDIVCPLPTVTTLPQGLESQIRDLRTQLRRLEPVNPEAQTEYEALAERHSFLREQIADLEQASTHLYEIIAELDEMMDTMFTTTFGSIASEFERVFALLFEGGSAALQLIDEDDGRQGVELLARPPGKRTATLNMLSGGERSLTAVALIFAVMRVSPTPFCVLDEVDAMLDEANVGRFRRMLEELARETQFIIITHNRGTVEVAETIYGISMGDDGVSEVLALSLEDLPVYEAV